MALSQDNKHLSRIIFRLKVIHESDQQTFENYFTQIMRDHNKQFRQVKPHGRYGDGKCDGFIDDLGIYYQVYAPETIKGTEKISIKKMTKAFLELKKSWTDNGFIVNEFYYFVNDKYQGVYQSWHTAAKEIEITHKIKCKVLTAGDLEDIFLELDEFNIINVIGKFDFDTISEVDMTSIDEVIKHVLNIKIKKFDWKIPKDPDFEEKIKFNQICDNFALFLNTGRLYIDQLKEYFKYSGSYIKEDLREQFSGLYEEAKQILPANDLKMDEVFWYIVKKSAPNDNKPVMDALFIVMAYYFEFCDIFEAPLKKTKPQLELF